MGPNTAPKDPEGFFARPQEATAIKDLLLRGPAGTVGVTGQLWRDTDQPWRVGVHGMGGVGKTLLAAHVAHDPEVAGRFPDGIFWLVIGQLADEQAASHLLARMADVAEWLEGQRPAFKDLTEAQNRLRRLLADRAVLLVLDDVWKKPHADAFEVIGPRGRVLVTTRDVALLPRDNTYRVDLLRPPLDEQFLAHTAGLASADALPRPAREVARECNGLPLALAICGKLAAEGLSWDSLLQALRQADIGFLALDPNDPQTSVMKSIQVGLGAFQPEEATRYEELAVFPADAEVPEPAVRVLWGRTGSPEHRLDALLTRLDRLQLLTATGHSPNRTVRLHDLQGDYIRGRVRERGQEQALHQALLRAYEAKWAQDPTVIKLASIGMHVPSADDGYFYGHFVEHLIAAGQVEQSRTALFDLDWLQSRLNATDVNAVIADYDLLIKRLSPSHCGPGVPPVESHCGPGVSPVESQGGPGLPPVSHPASSTVCPPVQVEQGNSTAPKAQEAPAPGRSTPEWVQAALRLSAHVLARDPAQLTGQLRGRLLGFEHAEIQSLVQQMASPPGLIGSEFLLPRTASLTPPGGPLLRTLEGHGSMVSSCVVYAEGRRALSGSDDRTLKVWDLDTGACLRTLEVHGSWVSSCVVYAEGRRALSGSWDKTLKVWNLDTGACLATFTADRWMMCCAIAPDGRRIVAGDASGRMHFLELIEPLLRQANALQ